jgi:hypothetical protein
MGFFLARSSRIAGLMEEVETLPDFAASVPKVVPIVRATLTRRPFCEFALSLPLVVFI